MEILFRQLTAGNACTPAPGELHLLPATAVSGNHCSVALLVLEEGLGAFPRGPGHVERIILDALATFDDLLAATFATHLLAKQPLPAGCKAFARYASQGRQGRRPGSLPFEQSLEGLYLACRLEAGEDLTDPATASRFIAHWARLAGCILRAAQAGVDPRTTPLCAGEPNFAAAKKLLARDHDLYRQDVARGQRWLLRVPGPTTSGLFLREPVCRLFTHWCRSDPDTPTGEPYRLVAVRGQGERWLLCADPPASVCLPPLAAQLGAAEAARGPVAAWAVEETGGPTVVVSPPSGTALAEQQVLEIIRAGTSARVYRHAPFRSRRAAALLAAAALAVMLLIWFPLGRKDAPGYRGFEPDSQDVGPAEARARNLHVLAVGVSRYKAPQFQLAYARSDALELARALKAQEGGLFQQVFTTVLDDDKATRQAVLEELHALTLRANPADLVVVSVAGHGANLAKDDRFYFLPYDYDPRAKVGSGIAWSQFQELLGSMPCQVFVVLDTCHSGTATLGLSGQSFAARAADGKALIVLAACLSGGRAQERSDWRHGVLTLALLEGLQGRRRYEQKNSTELPRANARGEVTIADLTYYVEKRVEELVGTAQAVVANNTGNIALNRILIARYPAAMGSPKNNIGE